MGSCFFFTSSSASLPSLGQHVNFDAKACIAIILKEKDLVATFQGAWNHCVQRFQKFSIKKFHCINHVYIYIYIYIHMYYLYIHVEIPVQPHPATPHPILGSIKYACASALERYCPTPTPPHLCRRKHPSSVWRYVYTYICIHTIVWIMNLIDWA